MAHPCKFNACCTWPGFGHPLCSSAAQQIGLGTAQQQGGRLDAFIQTPERRLAVLGDSLGRLRRQRPERNRNVGVVMQDEFVAFFAQHGGGQVQPLLLRMGPKRPRNFPQVGSCRTHVLKFDVFAQVTPNAQQRRCFDGGPNIIQHQATNVQFGLCSHNDTNQPAHAGTDPVNGVYALLSQQGNQGHHVLNVCGQLVCHRILQPVAVSAPCHIGANHPDIPPQSRGQYIKVPRLSAEPVDTNHNMLVVS